MEGEKEFNQLYLFACARGLLADAEGFLEKGVTPGAKDKECRTGAHFAASRGELEMLQFLHSKGVDVDAEDSTGRSPLHYAALRDHESTVAFLAGKGAWVDACDATDCSPLHLAARNNAAATAARLLHLGAKSHIRNQWHLTALGEALLHGHMKVCTAFSTAGYADADVLQQRVRGGLTLLHLAAGSGQAESVAWLLGKRLSVTDANNEEGLTPLHCCVLAGKLCNSTVEHLLRAGANCRLKDAQGRTPADILEHHHNTPGLSSQLAQLSQDVLSNIKQRLQPKVAGGLEGSPSVTSSAADQASPASASTPIVGGSVATPRGAAASGDSSGGRMSAAARLQAATSPEEVAEVLKGMPQQDRVHRVKLWARLPAEKLNQVAGLTPHGKQRLTEVHEAMCAAERARIEESLQKDARFQEDMATPAVRAVVDAVVAEPSMGPHVTGRAQNCLSKLRQLRDALKASGGGCIHLDRLLEPWTPAVGEQVRGMELSADALIRDTLEELCNAQTTAQPQGTASERPKVGGPLPSSAHTEITAASPRGAPAARNEGESDEALRAAVDTEEKPSLWAQAGQRLMTQLLIVVFLLALMWWRGQLPYQRKAIEAASLAFDSGNSWDHGDEL